jgi:hypothetical protein
MCYTFKQEMCASQNTPVYINYQTVKNSMWPSLVKIRYTEQKLLCGNLCGRPPAIPNHIIRPVSRRTYNQRLPGSCNRSPGSKLLSITTQIQTRWFLCEFPIGSYDKLSTAVQPSWSEGGTTRHKFGSAVSEEKI